MELHDRGVYMKVGFHSCSFNLTEESPVWPLIESLQKHGHEVVLLNSDEAQWSKGQLSFPSFTYSEPLDAFISYPVEAENFSAYMDQVKWLSDKYPSPTAFHAQEITNSKTLMAEVLQTNDVPMLPSYNAENVWEKEKVLSDIAAGKKYVFKVDHGGSGEGIIKITNVKDALEFMETYDSSISTFLMQEYLDLSRPDGTSADYRAVVVGDQVVGGIMRTTKPGEWRTNNSLGSTNEAYEFSEAVKKDAVNAMLSAGLGFGTVDLLIDPHTGKHYICEINDGVDMSMLKPTNNPKTLSDLIASMMESRYSSIPTQTTSIEPTY